MSRHLDSEVDALNHVIKVRDKEISILRDSNKTLKSRNRYLEARLDYLAEKYGIGKEKIG